MFTVKGPRLKTMHFLFVAWFKVQKRSKGQSFTIGLRSSLPNLNFDNAHFAVFSAEQLYNPSWRPLSSSCIRGHDNNNISYF